MKPTPESRQPPAEPDEADVVSRRDFLRNSVYAAYATPLITALLVERASAANSNACSGPAGDKNPNCP